MSANTNNLQPELAGFPSPAEQPQIHLLNRLAWSLRNTDPIQSLSVSEDALRLADETGTDLERAHALLARAYAQFKLSLGERAREDAEAALVLFEKLDDIDGYQRVLNTLGIIYGQGGDFGMALQSFLALKSLQEQQKQTRGLADTLNNIAILHKNLSDFADAAEYQLQSLRISEEADYGEGRLRALLNLGVVYLELARFSEAKKILRQSLELCSEDEDPGTYALVLVNLGYCHSGLDDLPTARECFEQGVAILQKLEDGHALAEALEGLGTVNQELGEFELADQYLRRSLKLRTNAEDRKGQAEALRLLGKNFRRQGRIDEALQALQRALMLAEEVGSKTDVYKIQMELSTVFEEAGQHLRALEHLRDSNRVKDQVFNERSDQKLLALRVGYEVETAEREREIFRLKNVELAQANAKLEALTRTLQDANEEQKKLLQHLDRISKEDGLTGLYNRRHFEQLFSREFQRAERYREELSVVICDVDNFKGVNDNFSHQVGDDVLKTLARLMESHTREQDIVARFGGEEFVMLLPQTSPRMANTLCERIRSQVEAHPWHEICSGLRVTLSVGISGDLSVANHEKLLALADEKLYEAKRTGKNRVCY